MNKRLLLLLVLILSVGFLVRQARADTLTVCAVGCDFSSVGTAVTAAAPGDTLQLAGETFNENIVILKPVTLQGEPDTILDGGSSGRVISVTSGVAVSLISLTVQNGSADDGGGIFNRGDLSLDDVVISGNTAVPNPNFGEGGGILNNNLLTINSSTIYNNSASDQGGGLRNAAGVTGLSNTIIAQNGVDCSGSGIQTNGYNLASDASCAFAATGDQNGINPQLGPLQDNGGATFTHALTESSPAFNAGNPAAVGSVPACPTADQRGTSRPQGGRCDIGAFELMTGMEPPVGDDFKIFIPIVLK